MVDASLTDYGVKASKNLATSLPPTDAVMTSTLLRAIQTGLYMFPKNTVYPVPYLKEVDYKPPNLPETIDVQKDSITALDGAKNAARVNYEYEADPQHECAKGDTTPRCVSSWPEFLNWLGKTLAEDPPAGILLHMPVSFLKPVFCFYHCRFLNRKRGSAWNIDSTFCSLQAWPQRSKRENQLPFLW